MLGKRRNAFDLVLLKMVRIHCVYYSGLKEASTTQNFEFTVALHQQLSQQATKPWEEKAYSYIMRLSLIFLFLILIPCPFYFFPISSHASEYLLCGGHQGCSDSHSDCGPCCLRVYGLVGKVDINELIILVTTYLQSEVRALKKRKRKTLL